MEGIVTGTDSMVIVGMGQIGTRFAHAAEALGLNYQAVTRTQNQHLLVDPVGVPLIVCVRENQLSSVLARIPPSRGEDLVVVQNGFIDELIEPYRGVTRAVLWFTVKGSFFANLLPSPVHGPRAELMRRLVHAAGASAEVIVDEDVFRRHALEKAVWSCVVGPPLAVWNTDLATARRERMADIEAIVHEACDVVRRVQGVEVSPSRVLATLDETSVVLGWMRGGTHAVAWRNGKIVQWGERVGVPTPANRAVVEAAGAMSEPSRG